MAKKQLYAFDEDQVRRVRNVLQRVEGSPHAVDTQHRKKTPVVVGVSTKIISVTLASRIVYGESLGITEGTLKATYTHDYYFSGMGVLATKIGAFWEIISPGVSVVRGVLDGDLASSSQATASIWNNDAGSWSDTGDNLIVQPWSITLNETIASGTEIAITKMASSAPDGSGGFLWAALAEECPAP